MYQLYTFSPMYCNTGLDRGERLKEGGSNHNSGYITSIEYGLLENI